MSRRPDDLRALRIRARTIQALRDSVIGPPSRRDLLALLGAAIGGFAAATALPRMGFAAESDMPEFGVIPDAWKGSGEVVAVTWGGGGSEMQRKAWYEPFERLCGIRVVEAVGPDPAKFRAMVEAPRVAAWNGRVHAARSGGAAPEIVWEGDSLISNAWLIRKGAPNLTNARKFVAFSSSAVAQARFSALLSYGFANVSSAALLSPELLANLPTAPGNVETFVPCQHVWWAGRRPETIET